MPTRKFRQTQALVQQPAAPASWRGMPLLRGLGAAELDALGATLVPVDFAAGDTLMRQGEVGDDLFFVESGRLTIQVDREDQMPFSRRVTAPTTVGEMALVTRAPRTATVVAAEPTRAFRLAKGDFDALMAAHPRLADVLTRLVGERLREIEGIRRVGKYDVTGPLGQGAVAFVYVGRHRELGHEVALKMLGHGAVHHPQFAAQFDREARVVALLDHPNVVRVLDTEAAYGTRFIVMERLRGALLEESMGRRRPRPWNALRAVLRDMCAALQAAHDRGLVHRDVKPANVFVTPKGARLLDFGIAILRDHSVCKGAARLGTPAYMAPEQILGQPLDGRTDVYALGVTTYEVITGRLPFAATDLEGLLRHQLDTPLPDPRHRVVECPADIAEFARRCAAKRPEERFASAAEAAAALEDEAEEGSIQVRLRFAPEHAAAVRAAVARLKAELGEGVEVRVRG